MAENEEVMNVREAGRKGGNSTLKRWGLDFFRKIGSKGGKRTARLYKDLLKDWGRQGGRPRRPALIDTSGEENLIKGGSGRLNYSSPGTNKHNR